MTGNTETTDNKLMPMDVINMVKGEKIRVSFGGDEWEFVGVTRQDDSLGAAAVLRGDDGLIVYAKFFEVTKGP